MAAGSIRLLSGSMLPPTLLLAAALLFRAG